MDLCNSREIKALLERHGFHFSKSMGQNFLIESWVPRDIAQASGADKGSAVLEIGPGIGPLTQQLSRLAGKVVSVELDRALLPVLSETMADCPNVEIVPGDILKLDIGALLDEKFEGFTPIACANLPYNITTPVLTALLECGRFASITVMIQREVARRICAAPGTAAYSAFTIYVQYHAAAEILFDVPADCFVPRPKVDSAVLRLTPLSQPAVETRDEKLFFALVREAFNMRRKTLVNALGPVLGGSLGKDGITSLIESVGLDTRVRGERLSLAEFARLADAAAERLQAQ